MIRRPRSSPLFPYTPLSRSHQDIPLRENRENRPARLDRRSATVRGVVELGEGQARELAHATEVDEAVRCVRSEEHTSELQSPCNLVCRLLPEKKKYHSILAQ